MKKTKPSYKWLDRTAMPPLPYYTLCTDADSFARVLKEIKIPETAKPSFYFGSFDASVSILYEHKKTFCIVKICKIGAKKRKPIDVACLLVHEAVHIAQEYWRSHFEKNPAEEQMAYVIQHISQQLMTEYERQIKT